MLPDVEGVNKLIHLPTVAYKACRKLTQSNVPGRGLDKMTLTKAEKKARKPSLDWVTDVRQSKYEFKEGGSRHSTQVIKRRFTSRDGTKYDLKIGQRLKVKINATALPKRTKD